MSKQQEVRVTDTLLLGMACVEREQVSKQQEVRVTVPDLRAETEAVSRCTSVCNRR